MSIFAYDLDKIVSETQILKRIRKVISFGAMVYRIKDMESTMGRVGYGLEVGLKCLFLQFFYDLSDRELEDRLRYDMAMRWFCGFSVDEPTPDHSFFGRVRQSIGTSRLHKLLRLMNDKAKAKGVMRSLFSVVDASAIKVKETTWGERDKALADGEETLNNDNIENYSSDPDARFGCKGNDKFWYGYKRHCTRDMGSGLIETVATTPANLPDEQGLERICPKGRVIFGDKAYCLGPAQKTMKKNGCDSAAILKNNMTGKNKDLDRWRSSVRAPYDDAFSKMSKRTRYRGLVKVHLQVVMEAICFNVKRLATINSPPLFVGA